MDRKGIIGLLICGILFAAHLYYSSIERKDFLEKQAAKRELAEQRKKEAEANVPVPEGEAGEAATAAQEEAVTPDAPEEEFRLETEKVTFVFTNKGGGIKYAEFKDQDAVVVSSERKNLSEKDLANPGKVHLNRYGDTAVGALVKGGIDGHLGLTYLKTKESERSVTYGATTPDGLTVAKTWTLVESDKEAGQYLVDLKILLKNSNETGNVVLKSYGIHAGSAGPLYKGEEVRGTGFFVYDGGLRFEGTTWFGKGFFRGPRARYEKFVEDVEYAGVSNQFFATLVGKKKPTDATIWAKAPEFDLERNAGGGKKRFVSMAWSLPDEVLSPGEVEIISYEIFMGPKDNKIVRQLGEGRGDVMHYGMFSFISRPLNWLLNFYHDSLFSKISDKWAWGFAIILVTFTIRVIIWPLHNASTKTMKRMSKLQPMMAELKEKYPDDPQKVQTETMKLYKEYEINPVGGCLPMFAQIPIFFGFYSMLRSAVELRGAQFMWVDDLSLPDTVAELPFGLPFLGNPVPINLLPLLMMATMFIQMQLTPKTGDAMQRRIFMLMPFMFFFFCYNFASALALYWTAQNIFSIGQTWWMQRQPEVDLKKRKPGRKSFMEKMAEKAEEAQRMQKEGKRPGASNAQPTQKPKKPRGPKTGG
ncbi:membrane protein insertase YidC [Roseibacillus ishigakijimensis]|uniref:Membrane protein insertase YidC n=1 Tax=Roseibacillus ishigakijimensis TaxID=454146 RepID=A0A934RRE1_9BACT|nr:membrane protein insertase YidC [Roseibacillus ishigakijimensis]MBK1834522.1 membrane protein insertase YidC [Roseibacillus ishigakijimensis]